ncbi:MAG: ATP synthase F1 subunit delta [Acidimicrobiales bacterium]
MLEVSRGYAAASIDAAEREGGDAALFELAGNIAATTGLLSGSAELRGALTDASIPAGDRRSVLEDLLGNRLAHEAMLLVGFAVSTERPYELPKVLEQLSELVRHQAEASASGERDLAEPPIGRSGAYDRIRGYGEHELESVPRPDQLDEIEDELFRFSRIVEQSGELRTALSSTESGIAWRVALMEEVLAGKVTPESLHLCCYVLRAGRVRDVVGALGYLVDLAAEERGRRVAQVRAAVELDAGERSRLEAALSRLVRRPVQLRITIDRSLIGGMDVAIGNTVIDGTVRHRLDQLRETLAKGA